MKIEQVAVQLYTLRDQLKTPQEISETLKKVREIGYQAVQISGLGPIADSELKSILDGEGLTICGTHESPEELFSDTENIIEHLKNLDCDNVGYPFPHGFNMHDEADVLKLIDELNRVGEKLHEAGIIFVYHNHHLEFARFREQTVLDAIYERTDSRYLQGLIDTYWVQYGGQNPVAWCRKLTGRLPIIHLKDYKINEENKPDFAEIGQGTLNWPEILKASDEAGTRWFAIEQDTCPGDPLDSLKISFDYIKNNLIEE